LKALFDTNILVDYAYGVQTAVDELDSYEAHAISRVVWIEFLTGGRVAETEARRRFIIEKFQLLEIDEAISEEAVLIRQRSRLKLPDAIILATARVHGMLLVTRNDRDFSRNDPDIRIPY